MKKLLFVSFYMALIVFLGGCTQKQAINSNNQNTNVVANGDSVNTLTSSTTEQTQTEQKIATSTDTNNTDQVAVVEETNDVKTIVVDNPELQKKINTLVAENSGLKKIIADSSAELNTMSTQYNDVLNKYNSINNALPIFNKNLEAMIKQAFDVQNARLNECRYALGLASVATPPVYIPTPTYYAPINNSIHCRSNTSMGFTYTDCY